MLVAEQHTLRGLLGCLAGEAYEIRMEGHVRYLTDRSSISRHFAESSNQPSTPLSAGMSSALDSSGSSMPFRPTKPFAPGGLMEGLFQVHCPVTEKVK